MGALRCSKIANVTHPAIVREGVMNRYRLKILPGESIS